MMVKWYWRKSRIIFPREIKHLVYLFSKSHYGDKNSETTKAEKLKFGQMKNLNKEVAYPQILWRYVTWFGAYAPKLVTAKFVK